ncbi:signal peptidase I [Amycolatopsis carbonis]|uniref:Signal peptidase I n=1 Tax=Amycolatopsis carbonis TaxID=715471 RepID=A0A9Y2IDG7_9PSEU|nr:signal peptidase I [Amycolatopsis sp. 2-15]WIX78052.1 signal peptidase I [Amycolatopsis sp. 2-15]
MTEPDFPPPPAPVQVKRRFSPLLAIFLVLAVAGVVLAITGVLTVFSYRTVSIRSGSMSSAVAPGSAAIYGLRGGQEIHRGDVVVFEADVFPGAPHGKFMQRVIAVGGDEIRCCDLDKRIIVNGKPVAEPYLDPAVSPADAAVPFEAKVPPGTVFVAGDTRNNSFDSRMVVQPYALETGSVPLSKVDGVVVATGSFFWPETVKPTTAFTDAGLSGASTEDTGPVSSRLTATGGAALFLLGFVGAIVTAVRRRKAAAAPPRH